MICKHKFVLKNKTCNKILYKEGYCKSHFKCRPKNNITDEENNDIVSIYNDDTTSDIIELNNNELTINNNSFNFENSQFKYIIDNKNMIWFNGKETITNLGYKDHINAMKRHIKDKYKKKMGNIIGVVIHHLVSENEKNTIYISESGLYELLSKSDLKNPIIKKFQDELQNKIIPDIKNMKAPTIMSIITQIGQTSNNINNINKINQLINIQNKIFNYADKHFDSIVDLDNNMIWFKCKDICDFLEYSDTEQAINKNLNEKYLKKHGDLKPVSETGLRKNEKNTKYVNHLGIIRLCMKSNKPKAEPFSEWIEEVINEVLRNNKYDQASSSNQQPQLRSFYTDNLITEYRDKNVLYIGVTNNLTKDNQLIYKYGNSGKIIQRDFRDHQNTFDNFNMIYIKECDNKDIVEKLFENELKAKKIHILETINNTKQKELFITDDQFDIVYIINILDQLIITNPLKSIEDRDNKIKQLENNNDINIELEKYKIDKEFELEKYKLDLEYKKFVYEKENTNTNIKTNLNVTNQIKTMDDLLNTDDDTEFVFTKNELIIIKQTNEDIIGKLENKLKEKIQLIEQYKKQIKTSDLNNKKPFVVRK
jgi:prophage antirepressor-like protein